jgi:integrase
VGKVVLTVKAINQRLKNALVGVSVLQRGDRLYLQATLPPKPGSDRPSRQLALGIYANEFGLAESEALAKKLGSELARGRFQWDEWLKRDSRVETADSVALAVARYRKFLEGTALTGDAVAIDRLWRRRYWNPALKWIPTGPLTRESLITAALHHAQNTRSRQLACVILQQFAKWAEITVDLKPYRGAYSTDDVERTIPPDVEILSAIQQIKNPGWRWVAGMMATYGLRDHECWYTTLSEDEDGVIVANISDGKTGSRTARPLPPNWVDVLDLRNGHAPKLTVRTNDEYGERTARHFKRSGVPFQPYDLRHAYGLRSTVELGIPVPVGAGHMGHSPELHLKIYNKHITENQKRDAYRKAVSDRKTR